MRVYDETRERYGRPLTLLAAEMLLERVGEGDHVLIVTNSHEMDGPPGAAVLARSLILGLRAIPVIVVNYREGTKFERSLPESCIGAELIPVTDPGELRGSIWTPYTVLIRNWPEKSAPRAREESGRLLDEFDPKALVTVEATSCNRKGIRHGALGGPRNSGDPEEEIVRWNELLDAAKGRGVLTIADGRQRERVRLRHHRGHPSQAPRVLQGLRLPLRSGHRLRHGGRRRHPSELLQLGVLWDQRMPREAAGEA